MEETMTSFSTTEAEAAADRSLEQRRNANYKPNIWTYDFLESLPASSYEDEKYTKEMEKLTEEVKKMFKESIDRLSKLELIDSITKIGLSSHFESEIRETLSSIEQSNTMKSNLNNNLYVSSLCFRLLRQYGYNVTQEIFLGFIDENNRFISSPSCISVDALCELLEASNYGLDDEDILKEAKVLSTRCLRNLSGEMVHDELSTTQLNYTLTIPLHWRLEWYDVKRQIGTLEQLKKIANSSNLHNLAKLNFNILQGVHQHDLKEVTLRWWKELGITNELSFARDRMVESFLLATGVAPERQHGSLRKSLAKVIQLILTVDDVYDIYGSLPELEKFTNAIKRWNINEVEQLPECMVTCFQILDYTTKEIACDIQKQTSCALALQHLRNAWADFCKAMLVEARWDKEGRTPTLEEYLSNGWISSSAPLVSVHVMFYIAANEGVEEVSELFEVSREIVYWASLIVRLCNDEGTSSAELARGDAPSSILCYMREENVTENVAREHIRTLIENAWMKINNHLSTISQEQLQFVKYMVNLARVGHFMYQHGDGFGVQDRETKQEIMSTLIEPFAHANGGANGSI